MANEVGKNPSFEMTFQLSFQDFLTRYRVLRSERRFAKFRLPVLWLIATVNIALSMLFLYEANKFGESLHFGYFINMVLGFCLIGLAHLGYPYLLKRLYRKSGVEGRTYDLRFDESGIEAATDGARSDIEWKIVKRCSCFNDCIFLWFSEIDGMFIPAHAFKSPDEMNLFCSFVTSSASN